MDMKGMIKVLESWRRGAVRLDWGRFANRPYLLIADSFLM